MQGDVLTYFILQIYPEVSRQGHSAEKVPRQGRLGYITTWRRVDFQSVWKCSWRTLPSQGLQACLHIQSMPHYCTLWPLAFHRSQDSSCSSHFILTLNLFSLFVIRSPHGFSSFSSVKILTLFLKKFFHILNTFCNFYNIVSFFLSTFFFIGFFSQVMHY